MVHSTRSASRTEAQHCWPGPMTVLACQLAPAGTAACGRVVARWLPVSRATRSSGSGDYGTSGA
jgi:hypothetical protein